MGEASQRQFLVKVDGIDGYWASKSGNEITSNISTVWNGGDDTPAQVAGPALPGPITISKPFVPERDTEIIAQLRSLVGKWRTTVSQQPTDADFNPVGRARNETNALLTRLVEPDADAASGNGSMWSLTFAPSSVV